MANIDWIKICRAIGIEYTATSDALNRGYINVKCPLCRDSDQGYHLGLHKSGRWSCFRQPMSHKGRDPRHIITLLTGWGYEAASELIEGGEELDNLSDFDEVSQLFLKENEETSLPKLIIPPEFKLLKSTRGRARLYWNYLKSRGYAEKEIPKLVRRYNLHYCDRGSFKGRIILPIYIDSKLVSWVGRTVYDDAPLRYKNLSFKPDASPRGLCSTRNTLYNFDNAIQKDYRVCVICEGPFDAITVDWYGYNRGITSVAIFGSGIGSEQIGLLDRVRETCEKLVICGDENAESNVMRILSETRDLGTKSVQLPTNIKDPGELNKKQVRSLFSS